VHATSAARATSLSFCNRSLTAQYFVQMQSFVVLLHAAFRHEPFA
jgi:hypothetical protein